MKTHKKAKYQSICLRVISTTQWIVRTREASGLTLNDSIVIVDEAHNLIDTLLNVYSVHLDLQEVIRANGQLSRYFLKYKTRLSPSNITYIQQLLFIMKKLIKVFAKSIKPSDNAGTKDPASASHIQPVTDFVFALGIDNINLFKLVNYCQKAMLVRKLNGFVDFSEAASAETADPSQPPTYIRRGSALAPIVEFLIAMQGSDCDGRIMVTKETSIETATKHPSKDKNGKLRSLCNSY
ncbi:hypothetical protein SARC_01104 [Sphaeroforma arctica JP610]|uniref:RAD3-like helicase DEAD domain-containing protein n=1 Tax=Sphaeroforma arctica JP610 TaxID=667725 RepID=A0A0L0GCM9_9EUKA|nr:hypothetical protein SARC_01104 [Sphaeroforma arctica JP610]KNC86770.1 hypothetical protein SARC_01104 [Sphaeroforma arctica JP610]|eukprot:XP_014160672.1 hypothetical protein SARC_01104 [Sphaeroforma arctica JP610]